MISEYFDGSSYDAYVFYSSANSSDYRIGNIGKPFNDNNPWYNVSVPGDFNSVIGASDNGTVVTDPASQLVILYLYIIH